MKFTIAASAALVAGASATGVSNGTVPVFTTQVVTAFTTFCPSPTQVVHNNVTYTVTKATTLTITNCPCTVTAPLTTSTVTPPSGPPVVETHPVSSSAGLVETHVSPSAPVETHVSSSAAPVSPAVPVAPVSPAAPGNATTPTAAAPSAATFTGAANQAFAASGAGLAGLLGLAAYIL